MPGVRRASMRDVRVGGLVFVLGKERGVVAVVVREI